MFKFGGLLLAMVGVYTVAPFVISAFAFLGSIGNMIGNLPGVGN